MCLGGKKKPLKQPKKEKGEMDEVCQQIHKS